MFLFVVLSSVTAQKSQRIGYIDMEYILSKVPEYLHAQNALERKVDKWKAKLNKESRAIEVLKSDLANEKAVLTSDLIEEKEEDIVVKEEALRGLENLYFGPEGDMYNLRRQLIKPIQDQVYNAVQTIAKKGNYDFVFNKSSDLIVLYSNKKYDISDLVIKILKIEQKRQDKADKIAAKKKLISEQTLTKSQKKSLDKKKKLAEQRKAKRKALEDARNLLKKKREAYRKAKAEKLKQKKNK